MNKMNLQENYKRLFKGKARSNDRQLMVEKFVPGQQYSSNFDYKGMLDYMKNIDVATADVKELQKVYDSATDVNYHTEASALDMVIDALKDGDMEEAQRMQDALVKKL